jgi:hypothetical protein
MPLRVNTNIAAKDNLPALTGGVPLDGLVTITLVYL